MRKKIYLPVLLCLFAANVFAQYPSSFSWFYYGNSKDDQRIQGPCNCFGTAALAEAWTQMLYGMQTGMSVQHLYSKCVSANGPGISPVNALDFIDTTGIVDSVNLKYGNTVTDTDPIGAPYFATYLGQSPNFPCAAPHPVFDSTSKPPRIFHIAGYQLFDFSMYSTLDSITRLKRMLLNYGPILMNFDEPNGVTYFHGVTPHCYVLFGWSTTGSSTNWLFKDSWPGAAAVLSYTGNFLRLIKNNAIIINAHGGPFVLIPTKSGGSIVNNAVYIDSLYGSTFSKANPKPVPFPVAGFYIDINGKPYTTPNQYVSTNSAALLSIEGPALFDSFTVHWSFTADPSTPTAAVTFSKQDSTATYVGVSTEGYVTIYGAITLANGVQIATSRSRVYASLGIPFKLVETHDACSGTTKAIQWEVQSRMAFNVLPSTIVITTPWTFTPAPGTSPSTFYGTSVLPNDIFNLDYTNLTSYTGYGLHVALTDAGYNNLTDGSTVGESVSPCGSHLLGKKLITAVYPNPAHNSIGIQAPDITGRTYVMKLVDMSGKTLIEQVIKGSINVDVSRLARGVYMLQFISSDKREVPILHRVVLD